MEDLSLNPEQLPGRLVFPHIAWLSNTEEWGGNTHHTNRKYGYAYGSVPYLSSKYEADEVYQVTNHNLEHVQ